VVGVGAFSATTQMIDVHSSRDVSAGKKNRQAVGAYIFTAASI
jgi:hypothetical protein